MRRSTHLLLAFLVTSGSGLACGSSSPAVATDAGSDGSDAVASDAGTIDSSADTSALAWAQTAMGGANIVPALAIDPRSPNTVFIGISAGSVDKGFFRTKDGGKTWAKIMGDAKLDRYAGPLAIHQQLGTVLLNPGVEGIWRSADGGDTFVQTAMDPGGAGALFFHPTANVAWALTSQQGVFRSNDGGVTWARTPNTGLPLNTFVLGPLAFDGTTLFLATNGEGVYVSTDSGDSWTKATSTGLPDATGGGGALNIVSSPSRPGVVFVQTKSAGLFRSADGAATFTRVQPGGGGGTAYWALRLDPSNAQTIFVSALENQGGPGGLFKSVNDGQSWTAIGPSGVAVNTVDVAPDGTIFVGTIGKGVWRFGK